MLFWQVTRQFVFLFLVPTATNCFFWGFKPRSETELFISLCLLLLLSPYLLLKLQSNEHTIAKPGLGSHHRFLLLLHFSAHFQVLALICPQQQTNPPAPFHSLNRHCRSCPHPNWSLYPHFVFSQHSPYPSGVYSFPITQIWTYHFPAYSLTLCYSFACNVYPLIFWLAFTFSFRLGLTFSLSNLFWLYQAELGVFSSVLLLSSCA